MHLALDRHVLVDVVKDVAPMLVGGFVYPFHEYSLFGVSIIVFVVMRILPGDPLVAMFGIEGFAKLTPGDRARIMEELRLREPSRCSTCAGCGTSTSSRSASAM